jgi:hypothetical protein
MEESMRRNIWFLCIWGSINIFTQTDIFPDVEPDEVKQSSQLQKIVDSYVIQVAELEEEL